MRNPSLEGWLARSPGKNFRSPFLRAGDLFQIAEVWLFITRTTEPFGAPIGAFSVGYHFIGLQKFAPKGWISGIAFTWGELYTRFAKQVMDGTWKSERKFGSLASDFLSIAPFGPAVPADAVRVVKATKQAFISGQRHAFQGPIKDNRGVERVETGQVLTQDDLGRMNWLVEGVIGQPR